MERYIRYRFPFDGRNLEMTGRPSVVSDLSIINMVFVTKMFSIDSFAHHGVAFKNYYRHLLLQEERPIVIDAGANIGAAALYFSEIYPKSRVFGIEPDLENFSLLNMNMLNRDFVGLHGALASHNGTVYLNTRDFGPISYRTASTGDTSVEAYGLTEIVERVEKDGRLLLVKIDIEGAEEEVFQRQADFLRRVPLLIMETHDWMIPYRSTSRGFYREICRHKFDILFRGENIFCFNSEIMAKYQQ
jgi:FkbM family methyltransferase